MKKWVEVSMGIETKEDLERWTKNLIYNSAFTMENNPYLPFLERREFINFIERREFINFKHCLVAAQEGRYFSYLADNYDELQ